MKSQLNSFSPFPVSGLEAEPDWVQGGESAPGSFLEGVLRAGKQQPMSAALLLAGLSDGRWPSDGPSLARDGVHVALMPPPPSRERQAAWASSRGCCTEAQ